jgi:hypothetical protein
VSVTALMPVVMRRFLLVLCAVVLIFDIGMIAGEFALMDFYRHHDSMPEAHWLSQFSALRWTLRDSPYYNVFADYWKTLLFVLSVWSFYPGIFDGAGGKVLVVLAVVTALALLYCIGPVATICLLVAWLLFHVRRARSGLKIANWPQRLWRAGVGVVAGVYFLGAMLGYSRWFLVQVEGKPYFVAGYAQQPLVGAMGDGDSGMRYRFKVGLTGMAGSSGVLSRASELHWRIEDEASGKPDSFERRARAGRLD